MDAWRWLAGLVAYGAVAASSAAAEPFTCSAFRDRLSGALVAAGDPDTEAPAFRDTRSTDSGGSHVNWTTSALTGSLACGAGDRFGEFYVSLDVTSRDRFVEQLRRLVTLDGAAVCTLATAAPGACTDAGKALLQAALEKMGAGFKRRVSNPSGISNRMLWPDIKAEVTAAPSLITFSLTAADGATPGSDRRPLPPAAPPPAAAPPPTAAPSAAP